MTSSDVPTASRMGSPPHTSAGTIRKPPPTPTSPVSEPTTAAAALRWFLNALDVTPADVPAEVDAQAALYRTLLADRRIEHVTGDGRIFLMRSGATFDIIEADALRPTSAAAVRDSTAPLR